MENSTARRYGGQSAEERDHGRLLRLRAAALDLFGTQGYQATSIDRLCSTASVSTRHFYLQFSCKEDLLLDLYGAITADAYGAVAESLATTEGQDFRRRIDAAVRAYLRPVLADPRTARIAFVEIVGVSPRVEQKRLDFRATIVALVEEEGRQGVARNEIDRRDFHFLALCLSGAINVVVHDWMLQRNRAPAERLEGQLSALAVHLLTGDATPI
ncbi:MAG: TetR/AcrR family transcriptional regulator [Propionibacteriales bacterium]|nr:TetR/AcrR family transcriptional regulator [Propionibacteriales bacterium]